MLLKGVNKVYLNARQVTTLNVWQHTVHHEIYIVV